jgi:hypothetical protein
MMWGCFAGHSRCLPGALCAGTQDILASMFPGGMPPGVGGMPGGMPGGGMPRGGMADYNPMAGGMLGGVGGGAGGGLESEEDEEDGGCAPPALPPPFDLASLPCLFLFTAPPCLLSLALPVTVPHDLKIVKWKQLSLFALPRPANQSREAQ